MMAPVCGHPAPGSIAARAVTTGEAGAMIRKGQRYRTLEELQVTCMTKRTAPFTGGYRRILAKGETFTVSHEPVAGATAVYCDPENYDALHHQFVPRRDRWRIWIYRGYYLCIDLDTIEQKCEPVEAAEDG